MSAVDAIRSAFFAEPPRESEPHEFRGHKIVLKEVLMMERHEVLSFLPSDSEKRNNNSYIKCMAAALVFSAFTEEGERVLRDDQIEDLANHFLNEEDDLFLLAQAAWNLSFKKLMEGSPEKK